MNDLATCRDQIDAIDKQILELLKQRQIVAESIAAFKLERNQMLTDRVREQEKLSTLMTASSEIGVSPILINEIYRTVMKHTVSFEQSYVVKSLNEDTLKRDTSVAYLGPRGTYSHLAACQFLSNYHGQITEYSCSSFAEILSKVESGLAEIGVLPIENSSSGSINESLDLLQLTKSAVVGEHFSPIDHAVLAVEEMDLKLVTDLYTHPQPYTQCSHWIASYIPQAKVHFTSSTSEAMQKVADLGVSTAFAIGSQRSGPYFKLHHLVTDIANNKRNFTRFILLSMTPILVPSNLKAKTSIQFCTKKYLPGSLMTVLGEFSEAKLNVTKLTSRPREDGRAETWEEMFFADIEANINTPIMQTILARLKDLTTTIKVLGCYPSDERHH